MAESKGLPVPPDDAAETTAAATVAAIVADAIAAVADAAVVRCAFAKLPIPRPDTNGWPSTWT